MIDPDEPLPSTLEQMERQASENREERMQVQKRQQEQEKVLKAFTNPWLVGMETVMAECNRRLEGTEDAEMRAVLMSLLEINSNNLRLFHQKQGALGKQEALTERKKLCLERGLVEKSCVDCIVLFLARDCSWPVSVQGTTVPVSLCCLRHREARKAPTTMTRKKTMTKCACHRKQKRFPTSLRLTFRVHCHPSRWVETREKARV